MSGLEKFQAEETYLANFKKFFNERKPKVVKPTLTITESQRYSLDIDENLKNIIEQKKNKKALKINLNEDIINIQSKTRDKQQPSDMNHFDQTENGKLAMWQKTSDESFESLEKMCEKSVSDPNSTLFKYLNDEHAVQKSNNLVMWQKTSDESFEALERMCDKTASDPNSTLFQYLHSDCKDQVLEEVKKRSADGNNKIERNDNDNLLMKLSNCTLLDDIEEPSRMWENTICGDTIVQTSPVKMVGLLRPSTIVEEAPDDSTNSDVSSQMSFRTAPKACQSDVSSSTYGTAHESTIASTRTDFSSKSDQQEHKVIDVDHILLLALAKNEQTNYDGTVFSPTFKVDTTVVGSAPQSKKHVTEIDGDAGDVSVDLIDLEETFGPLKSSPHSFIVQEVVVENNEVKDVQHMENEFHNANKVCPNNVLDDSVIEVLSDEDDVNEAEYMEHKDNDEKIMLTNIKTEMSSKPSLYNIDNTYSDDSIENDKENYVQTKGALESMKFNDTMEEVEYMIKKGMEYMAAEAAAVESSAPKTNSFLALDNPVSKTQPNLHLSNKKSGMLTSPISKAKTSTYTTPAKKRPLVKDQSSSKQRFDIDIGPFPKLDIFAKPALYTRSKELTNKQQKFSHIVSPIGAYMKKTAKTPLMSSINSNNRGYFNSTAILELENESRLYQPQFTKDLNGSEAPSVAKLPGLANSTKRPLPKKAYISSELKHIVDERTPVTIPGGKTIQKYLENAMMPAVLRHEGKFKIPGGISNKFNTSTASSSAVPSKLPLKSTDTNSTVIKKTLSHTERRNNASLADLSVMSGDVSMYTIMDAQKF